MSGNLGGGTLPLRRRARSCSMSSASQACAVKLRGRAELQQQHGPLPGLQSGASDEAAFASAMQLAQCCLLQWVVHRCKTGGSWCTLDCNSAGTNSSPR